MLRSESRAAALPLQRNIEVFRHSLDAVQARERLLVFEIDEPLLVLLALILEVVGGRMRCGVTSRSQWSRQGIKLREIGPASAADAVALGVQSGIERSARRSAG